jgi:uncharacterized BrkB/YihY/UPF0761 family membrane protein
MIPSRRRRRRVRPERSYARHVSSDRPSLVQRTSERAKSARTTTTIRLEQLEASNLLVRLGADFVRRYLRTNAGLLAGSLAYRIFLVLVPAALVIVAAAGSAHSQGVDLEAEVGGEMGLGQALATSIAAAGEDAGNGWQVVLTIGVLGLLTGASSLFSAMHRSYAQVWEIPLNTVRRTARARVQFMLGFVVFLLLLSLLAWVRRVGPVLGFTGALLIVAVALALLVALSAALPHRATDPLQLLPGAVVGGVAVIGLQVFSAVWVPRQVENYSETYGAIGVAVALLVYLAILGNVLVLVPLANATWWDHVSAERTPEPVDRVLGRLRDRLPFGAADPATEPGSDAGADPPQA